jgi:hypothetical protein
VPQELFYALEKRVEYILGGHHQHLGDNFLKYNDPNALLACRCVSCLLLLEKPVSLSNCSHTVCESCLPGLSRCPLCKKSVRESSCKHDASKRADVYRLKLHCPLGDCDWVGKLSELQPHVEEDCDFSPMLCQNSDCSSKLVRCVYLLHLKVCKHRPRSSRADRSAGALSLTASAAAAAAGGGGDAVRKRTSRKSEHKPRPDGSEVTRRESRHRDKDAEAALRDASSMSGGGSSSSTSAASSKQRRKRSVSEIVRPPDTPATAAVATTAGVSTPSQPNVTLTTSATPAVVAAVSVTPPPSAPVASDVVVPAPTTPITFADEGPAPRLSRQPSEPGDEPVDEHARVVIAQLDAPVSAAAVIEEEEEGHTMTAAEARAAAASRPVARESEHHRMLRRAAFDGDVAALQQLLEVPDTDVNSRDKGGMSLLVSAALNGRAQACRTLLRSGADPSLCSATGNGPLHYLCKWKPGSSEVRAE